MKNQYKIEEEIQKTMQSLNQLDRVEGNPYLYTRIKARLKDAPNANAFRLAGVMQIVMVAALLIVNLISINKKVEASFGEDVILESMANDYGLQSSESIYNYYDQN